MECTKRDAFSDYNPMINFIFFIGAFIFTMLFYHPLFLGGTLMMSGAYYVTVKGSESWKFLTALIPTIVILSLVNPIFNTLGDTVLFTYLNERTYTLEALFYGIALAVMFVSILLWFSSYNAVMTSDKFMFLFGKFAPSITLVFTMILRLVPQYQKKLLQISDARKCIGKSVSGNRKKDMIENGTTMISALTSWALEGGVVTADSMRSRGYGCGRRTSFSIYRFALRDKTLMGIMIVLMTIVFVCSACGGTYISYIPSVEMAKITNPYMVIGWISYLLFLSIPTLINLREEMTWYILRSKI